MIGKSEATYVVLWSRTKAVFQGLPVTAAERGLEIIRASCVASLGLRVGPYLVYGVHLCGDSVSDMGVLWRTTPEIIARKTNAACSTRDRDSYTRRTTHPPRRNRSTRSRRITSCRVATMMIIIGIESAGAAFAA